VEIYNIDKSFVNEASLKAENIAYVRCPKTTWGDSSETNYPNIVDEGQFVHELFSDGKVVSPFFEFYKKVFDGLALKIHALVRMKINLCYPVINNYADSYQIPHYDVPSDINKNDEYTFKSFFVYLNDSDGDTVFFKDNTVNKRVKFETGNGILFNSDLLHAGQNPMKHNSRLVLTTVFAEKK